MSIFIFIVLKHLAIMDEAIAGTYWVAGQNGVSYTEEQIQAKFLEQLDEQLIPITEGFIDDMEDRLSMAPQIISPVEVSAKEQVLVFRG